MSVASGTMQAGGKKREENRLKSLEIKRLTACVTRAGAGGGTPSDWENAEA
ncbi:MAG: hypothetical protein HKUEN02_22050 [Anaerolineaceae bacterium]|nr:MAG: hypothetical protein HKUEN02_22050 [Anaerolineaceae bacterium]